MSVQTPLLPSLFALLPPKRYTEVVSNLSLQSIHAEPYTITETIYHSTTPDKPGQLRDLRLQARLLSPSRYKGKRKQTTSADGSNENDWDYNLAYLSAPLSGREYADMNVKGHVRVDLAGKTTRERVEAHIITLGYVQSHTYTRSGILFHLSTPNPNFTLHLSITKLKPGVYDGKDRGVVDGEAWLVELQPSKSVLAVSNGAGEMGLGDVMALMRAAADRAEGLDWSTGR